jgi:hypothetical protein
MSAENLATCLMPSLFRMSQSLGPVTGLRRRKTISMPSEKERMEYTSMKVFLTKMIKDWQKLLVLPRDIIREKNNSNMSMNVDLVVPLKDGRFELKVAHQQLFTEMYSELVNEYLDKWNGWTLQRLFSDGTCLSVKNDENMPLKQYLVQVNIPAPVNLVHAAILQSRHLWDVNAISCKRISSHGQLSDIVKVTYRSPMETCIDKLAYVARRWTYHENEGIHKCTIIERSITPSSHSSTEPRVNILRSAFLITPEAGQSQLTYISQIDLRGKTLQWYDKVYAPMIAQQMRRFRQHFVNSQLLEYNGRETVI